MSVLLGNGDGTFQAPSNGSGVSLGGSGAFDNSVAFGDFNEDGQKDRVVAQNMGGSPTQLPAAVTVSFGNGDGTFSHTKSFTAGISSEGVVVSDFNVDGHSDLAVANSDGTVSVLLGDGHEGFQPPPKIPSSAPAIPLLAHLSSPQVLDSLILRDDGSILFRKGRVGQVGTFDPPLLVNSSFPLARDIALVSTSQGTLLAALDRVPDPVTHRASISLYAYDPASNTFSRTPLGLTVGDISPIRILAADLTGSSRAQDLIVYSSLSGTAAVLLSNGIDGFQAPDSIRVGFGGSALATAPGQFGNDVLITNQGTSSVIQLINDGTGHFSAGRINQFRAAAGPFSWDTSTNSILSLQQTTSLLVGAFTGIGHNDIVTINPGGDSFALLAAQGNGSYLNPVNPIQAALGFRPGNAASGNFDPDGLLDLAILDPDHTHVAIYSHDPQDDFVLRGSCAVGDSPTGLSVADVDSDGKLDLLVGNTFGDVLILLGNGDGTFRPFTRIDQAVPFVITNGNGDVVLANQSIDQAMSQVRQSGTTAFSTGGFNQQGNGLIGPGAVTLANLDGQNGGDLIVANSGNNNVLIYLRQANGSFVSTPQSFFAGTSPASIAAQDLNNDGIMDLAVANRGSNDVSVLFGKIDAGVWTLTPGPRLNAGNGPLGVFFQDRNDDGIPEIIISNSDGTITSLPGIGSGGVGTGFFDDTNPTTTTLPAPIVSSFINGLIATQAGIFQFNFADLSFTQLFASTALTAFTTAAINGNIAIFGGFADGSIRLIDDADLDGEFAESLIFRDAQLTDPSALQVVDNNGQTEIYATSSGQSRVFVFGLSEGVSVSSFNDFGVFRDAVVQVQTASDGSQAGIALVAVIVIGDRGEDALDSGDSVFIVGLSPDASPDAATLALLTALLTGTGGEEEGDVGGTEDNGPTVVDERVTLEGFIAGVEEAVKRFQQQLAPMPEGGDAPLPEWSRTLDQVFSRWAVTAQTAADLLQEPAQRGSAWLSDDGGLGRGAEPPAVVSDGDASLRRAFAGVEFGLRNAGAAVQQAWQDAYGSLPNSLPAWPKGETPGEMGMHDEDRRLLVDRDSDWLLSLASALVVAGLWPVRQTVRKQDRRCRLGAGA